jgi:hypothetical protein
MARKITVLESHSDAIARRVKKCVAELQIRRLVWAWVDGEEGYTARILPLDELPRRIEPVRTPAVTRPRCTDPSPAGKLPPLQIPGVRFENPQTHVWREAGRHLLMH